MSQSREEIINDLVQPPYLQRYQDIENRNQQPNTRKPKNKNVKNLIPASKRLTITYIVFVVWIALVVFGILMETDIIALSVYFASGLPLIIGYLWSETSRPSGSIKDVSKLVESMRGHEDYYQERKPYNPHTPNGGYHNGYTPGQQQQQTTTIIISDDNSEKLEIKETELDTLINSGYVDKANGKYTFKREKKEEIVSLLDGQELKDEGIYSEEEASI
jgi:hypothetical protein